MKNFIYKNSKVIAIFLFIFAFLWLGHASSAPVANIFRNIQPEADITYTSGTSTPLRRWLGIYAQDASTTNLTAFNRVLVGGTATTTIVGNTATSTFAWSVNVPTGQCFQVNGTCVGGGGGSGITSLNGLTGGTQTFSAQGNLGILSAGTVHTFTGSSSPFFGNITATGTIAFPAASISNATLANSSLTINSTAPLGGGGAVSLGGALTLTCSTCLTAAITSLNGLTGSTQTFSANGPLAIVSAGTVHTFNASSSPYFGTLTASSTASFTSLTAGLVSTLAGGVLSNPTISSPLTFSANTLACSTCLTAAITSLNGLTGATQTFQANGPLGILSAGTVHNFNASSSPYFGTLLATSTALFLGGNVGIATTSPGSIFSVNGTQIISGTSSPSGLNVASTSISIAGVPYNWPTAQGAASTNLQNNGNGGLTWAAGGSGITTLNTLTGATQTFSANGPINIVSAGTVHTFNASSSPSLGFLNATSTSNSWFTGSLGIGTTGPLSKLDVKGGVAIGTYAGANAAPANGLIVSGNVGIALTNPGAPLAIAQEASYTFPNPGSTAKGAINIRATLGNLSTGVTFSSAATDDAQAGLYVRMDNNSGTYMYLATTDSFATGPQARVTILNNGNVGIGTTTPGAKLNIIGALCVDDTTPTCADAARTDGNIYAVATTITGIDVAERYPTKDTSLEAGDLVSLDAQNPVFVAKSSPFSILVGVVSTKPGIELGGFGIERFPSENTLPVALIGRVPVKVNLEGGMIKIGDRITSSSIPGVGMKANLSGTTIGIALEPFDGITKNPDGSATRSDTGKILVFLNLGYAKLDNAVSELTSTSPESAHPPGVTGSSLFVGENGNIGIGTTTPISLLNLDGTATTTIRLGTSGLTSGTCIEMVSVLQVRTRMYIGSAGTLVTEAGACNTQ